jgi:hypothetical protein
MYVYESDIRNVPRRTLGGYLLCVPLFPALQFAINFIKQPTYKLWAVDGKMLLKQIWKK